MDIVLSERENLKAAFVSRFEELIISGTYPIGSRLPSERDLASLLGVSRPVVREGLVELQSMGLVSMRSRSGTVVNDYRREGSLSLLEALFKYDKGEPDRDLLNGMISMRGLFEVECARLAALNRTEAALAEFASMLDEEGSLPAADTEAWVDVDFRFHHLIALSSGNPVYPLQINSLKPFYRSMTRIFYADLLVVPDIRRFHKRLVRAIADGDGERAAKEIRLMLEHGEKGLQGPLTRAREERA